MLEGCSDRGAQVDLLRLDGVSSHDEALESLARADAVILASPTYRSTHTSLLGGFLELVGRDPATDGRPTLAGKVTAVLMTGASAHHFLAPTGLLQIVTCFFGTQVLAPPLYFDKGDFASSGELSTNPAEIAREHGRALVDLAAACRSSRNLRPLV
jgi:FMN reductase